MACNYLPQVRVLANSWHSHHPESPFYVLVIDGRDHLVQDEHEPFTVLNIEDLDISSLQYQRMALVYDTVEFATALKPFLLLALRQRHGGVIVYLDADIELFAPLSYLLESSLSHPIALIPHLLEPMPDSTYSPREHDILAAGVYNLGFISTATGSEDFLRWWADRLLTGAIIDFENNLFTNQRWADFAPCFTDIDIIRHRGWNVAYWNLGTRRVHEQEGTWYIDDEPLVFFHFSGYSPRAPHLLTTHCPQNPRILLSERPELLRLTESYREKLMLCGWTECPPSYGYARLPNGLELDRNIRRILREGLLASCGSTPFAQVDPFSPEGAALVVAYLNEPAPGSWSDQPPSRYYIAHYNRRTDLQVAFPNVLGSDAPAFRNWIYEYGQHELPVPRLLMPDRIVTTERANWASPSQLTPGIAVAGYFTAEVGVGEAGRAVLSAVQLSGIPSTPLLFENTLSRKEHPFPTQPSLPNCDTNIIAINADQLAAFAHHVGIDFFEGRYNIGFWFWETEVFPSHWNALATTLLQEIWVASPFTADAIRRTLPLPVKVFPLPVTPPSVDSSLTRSYFGIPEDVFVFMFMFDYFSVFERKNPLGVIKAYCDAFAELDGCCLVIKSINGEDHRAEREELRYYARGRKDILLLEDYLTPVEKNSLLNCTDCYVSLHRSEGFGLTIAEAMLLGKPVIATGYSGNLAFTNETNSYLVPYNRIPIPKGCGPYPEAAFWADPDLHAAAEAMRIVRSDVGAGRARTLGEPSGIASLADAADFVKREFDGIHQSMQESQKAPRTRGLLPRRLRQVVQALRG